MTKLSRKQYEQAKTFLKTKARKLERGLFEFEFENGDSQVVLNALKTYQNDDGGFGNGLEPDFRCRDSSALATSIALQLLIRIGATEKEETVRKAIGYLLQTFNEEKMGWQIVPREVEKAPRAVWWNYSEEWAWGNPSAELIGHFHHYEGLVKEEFLEKLTQFAITYINNSAEVEHHELLCFLRMAEQLPKEEQAAILNKLRALAIDSVTTSPDKWDSYCLLPLQVVSSPDSEFHESFQESIPLNLRHLVIKQTEHGYWDPTWSWGQYEEDWENAKEEWRGWLTLENLKILRAFDHID
ncbi:hypothetical protein QWY14_02870 [Planococcus sp. N028]|uniref:Prenyltransferase n=1 Tax=Planococcus shixiaomingii TaxID=3058393 RepID=A0ABT8MYJ7_9BACL|nr:MULTISPECIES: hypothetical protein [unclassified Planococcus (in: firmicutes)]MDN7240711.1 hypothetical protein [Planococcus sp. N028]WKA56615.1 hypothetical protein QWY21_09795 [Planococcus sp. N022]